MSEPKASVKTIRLIRKLLTALENADYALDLSADEENYPAARAAMQLARSYLAEQEKL